MDGFVSHHVVFVPDWWVDGWGYSFIHSSWELGGEKLGRPVDWEPFPKHAFVVSLFSFGITGLLCDLLLAVWCCLLRHCCAILNP